MTPETFLTKLCACRGRWQARSQEIEQNATPYVDGARLGRELVEAVARGYRGRWISRAFGVIERALVEGDEAVRELVVAGLFEAMQNAAFRQLDPPDALDEWLGPQSRVAWANLIEGWTGTGIRSIEHWRRVVLNGRLRSLQWKGHGERLEVHFDDLTVRGSAEGERRMEPSEAAAFAKRTSPLVASALLPADFDLGTIRATISAASSNGNLTLIEVGRDVAGGQACQSTERKFVLDAEALRAALVQLGVASE